MVTTAIVCPECRRVVALGAKLPAICFAAIPMGELATLRGDALDGHPKAHHDCVELELPVPADGVDGPEALAAMEKLHAAEIAAVSSLASQVTPVST